MLIPNMLKFPFAPLHTLMYYVNNLPGISRFHEVYMGLWRASFYHRHSLGSSKSSLELHQIATIGRRDFGSPGICTEGLRGVAQRGFMDPRPNTLDWVCGKHFQHLSAQLLDL